MQQIKIINIFKPLLLFVLVFTVFLSCKDDNSDGPADNPPFLPIDFERGENFWWPEQKSAPTLITLTTVDDKADYMLAESLSGLAAKAVNNGDNDELVWIVNHSASMDEWFRRLKERIQFSSEATMNTWELVEHFKSKGIIKGYVLYRFDTSVGDKYQPRDNMDISSNVATSAAGVLNGIIIDESQEQQAINAGLTQLMDARNISYRMLFDMAQIAINPFFITLSDPQAFNLRGYVIANNIFILDNYTEGNVEYFLNQVEPVSPSLGWGFGDEGEVNRMLSVYGLFNTASNWCYNLPVLSAGAQTMQFSKVKTLDPKDIDWNKNGYFHSFTMSDGDNMQWLESSFFHNDEYWANSAHGEFPFAWTTCAVNMSQAMPDAENYMAETQPDNVTIIEYGGGYQYPDLFAKNRDNRKEALTELAKKVNYNMKRTGVKVFGFICQDINSDESKEAYKIFAEEIEDLTGMIVVQYHPYEVGNGKIFWVTNKDGVHIPVVTSKFTIWARDDERVGDPWKIAGLINEEAAKQHPPEEPVATWTMVHSWSEFEHNGELARGLTPVKWCVDDLSNNVQVISIEEMLWRLRMQYYPDEVNTILAK